jgi:hypothetical protein
LVILFNFIVNFRRTAVRYPWEQQYLQHSLGGNV